MSEGVVLVVCLALGGLLDTGGLALVLMAFASVIGWVLVFCEDFYLFFKLFLVLHPVFLDLAFQKKQLVPFFLNFLHLYLV